MVADTTTVVKEVKKREPAALTEQERELQHTLEESARKDASFQVHVAREGPAIAQQVHREAIAASAAESAKGQEDKAAADAIALDALDELQMAEELRGRVILQYFYEFESKGRKVTGISWAGVKAIARHMALKGESITIASVEFSQGEDQDGPWIGCLVKARNAMTGEERFAWAAQATAMKLRDGGRMPDPFAKTKALNKAQRNALRQFIPEAVVVEMFKAWKEGDGKALPKGASS